MQELFTSVLNAFGYAWWVEITTASPRCVYYFGPFINQKEAEAHRPGYIEDLQQEGAQGIAVVVKQCNPSNLTIFDESGESSSQGFSNTFSSQLQ